MSETNLSLRSYPTCPICGSGERRPSPFQTAHSGFYVNVLAATYGLSGRDLTERLASHRCERCGTIWYDPWIGEAAASAAYGYIVGRHKEGWSSIVNWVNRDDDPSFPTRARVQTLLTRMFDGLSFYAEVNCPFLGLLPMLLEADLEGFDRTIISRKMSALHAMYGTIDSTRNYAKPVRMTPPSAERPRRLLIEIPSPMCWSASCSFSGANCRAVANELLVDRVTDFESLARSALVCEVIAFFNTFDPDIPDGLPI